MVSDGEDEETGGTTKGRRKDSIERTAARTEFDPREQRRSFRRRSSLLALGSAQAQQRVERTSARGRKRKEGEERDEESGRDNEGRRTI